MEVMYFVPTASLDSNAKLKNYLAKVPCCDELQTLEKTSAQVWIVVLTQKLCQQTLATCKLRQQLDPSQKFIFLVDQKELCFWMYRYQLQVTAVIFCYAKTWYQELMAALQELEKAEEKSSKSSLNRSVMWSRIALIHMLLFCGSWINDRSKSLRICVF